MASAQDLSEFNVKDSCVLFQLGPNVSVGSNVVIGAGARVRETILLDGAELKVMSSCITITNALFFLDASPH